VAMPRVLTVQNSLVLPFLTAAFVIFNATGVR